MNRLFEFIENSIVFLKVFINLEEILAHKDRYRQIGQLKIDRYRKDRKIDRYKQDRYRKDRKIDIQIGYNYRQIEILNKYF